MSFPFVKDLTASIAGDADSEPSQPSSAGGLFSSAKIVADAAQSAYKRESFDQAKAAGAAEDILSAASTYGKLDEKGYGKYVDQAEGFLQKYKGPVDVKPPSEPEEVKSEEPVKEEVKSEEPVKEDVKSEEPTKEEVKSEEPMKEEVKTEEPVKEKPSSEEEGKSGGSGYGDYMKMAEGFVEKYQSGEEGDGKTIKESGKEEASSGGGGYGDYFKMAEGFLKK